MTPTSSQLLIAHKILAAQEAGNPVDWQIRKLVPMHGKELQEGEEAWIKASASNNPVAAMNWGHEIRLTPFVLGPSINGHTLGPGQQWHRLDFTREDLPPGTRPHILGELDVAGDERLNCDAWMTLVGYSKQPSTEYCGRTRTTRTTRPLPPTSPPVPEGWRELPDAEKDGKWIEGAKFWSLGQNAWAAYEDKGAYSVPTQRTIVPILWHAEKQAHARVAPTSVTMIPLGPLDIEPGSTVRRSVWNNGDWTSVTAVSTSGIWIGVNDFETLWSGLIDGGWLIHRPSAPGVWSKCEKEIP